MSTTTSTNANAQRLKTGGRKLVADGDGARWGIGYSGPNAECFIPRYREKHYLCAKCPFIDCGSKILRGEANEK